jgi:pre-mRNA-processing factor 19
MSSFTCALSGEPLSSTTEEIVVTPSGHVCLKRLLLTKLSENGGMDPFEPIRERPLSEDQLISLNTSNKSVTPPRPQVTSLPNLLGVIQKEYDALVLELFDTRKALEDTRRELSQALYQNDAATRVVARLAQERDAARQELQNWNASVATTPGAAPVTVEAPPATVAVEEPAAATATAADEAAPPSKRKRVDVEEEESQGGPLANDIPESHLQQMVDTWSTLHKERKPMLKAAATKALSPDQFKALKEVDSKSCHDSRTKSVTAMAGCGNLLVTAARDKNVIVYDTAAKVVQHKLPFGSIVSSVDVNETTVVAASGTKVVVYSLAEDAKVVGEFQADSAVVDLRLHPTKSHVCVATESGKLSLLSVNVSGSGVSEISVFSADDTEYTCGALHPDGLIYAAGTKKGQVHMWDFKNKVLASTLQVRTILLRCLLFYYYYYYHSMRNLVDTYGWSNMY